MNGEIIGISFRQELVLFKPNYFISFLLQGSIIFDSILPAITLSLCGVFSSYILYKLAAENRSRFLTKIFILIGAVTFAFICGLGEYIWMNWINPPKSGEEIRREQIQTWAKSIVNYENRFEVEMTEFYNLVDLLDRRDLTEAEFSRLQTCQQNVLAISKEARNLKVPSKVSNTQLLIIDYYTKAYDAIYNFNQGVTYYDSYYINKASFAASEAERIGENANNQFKKLMDEFNIACTEINFCE